jgi:phosphohistidine phosphatase
MTHSGKTRAEQTALLLAPAFSQAPEPQAQPGLSPKDPVEPLARSIADWTEDTLIVGHLPFLARLVSQLVSGDPERPILAFQPGSLACLARENKGDWRIAWMILPDLLTANRS